MCAYKTRLCRYPQSVDIIWRASSPSSSTYNSGQKNLLQVEEKPSFTILRRRQMVTITWKQWMNANYLCYLDSREGFQLLSPDQWQCHRDPFAEHPWPAESSYSRQTKSLINLLLYCALPLSLEMKRTRHAALVTTRYHQTIPRTIVCEERHGMYKE